MGTYLSISFLLSLFMAVANTGIRVRVELRAHK